MTTNIYNHEQNIRELQIALRSLHRSINAVPLINPDGFFGPETTAAVLAAQEFFGIPRTGEADLETWTLLFENYYN